MVGEDLGTIPAGFQDEMAAAGVLGMRVLWFERDLRAASGQPRGWTHAAAAMTSTHDLPTLAGWWRGRDLEWRAKLDLAGGPENEAQDGHDRFRDRFMLWDAMQDSGAADGDPPPNDEPARFVDAATRHVAGAACDLAILPIEDALGLAEQPNLPGTMSEQHPNWRAACPAPPIPCWTRPQSPPGSRDRRGRRAEPPGRRMKPLSATARLQFHKDFTLDDATRLVPYFDRLGISHLYASPLLKARAGSTHGYDIVDHNQINPELGGEAALHRMVAALRERGMGLILDIVPNHMGVGGNDNAWWLDVLEWGRASPYAEYFDIDWDPPDPTLRGRMLAPFLGSPYGECLQNGELVLNFDESDGRLFVAYHDHRFPIAPRDYAAVLLTVGGPLEAPARAFADLGPGGRAAVRQAAEAAREELLQPTYARPSARRCATTPPRPPLARSGCTACSSARPIAWPGGAPRRTRSTGAASSTSTASPASAKRCRKCSRPPTAPSSASTARA